MCTHTTHILLALQQWVNCAPRSCVSKYHPSLKGTRISWRMADYRTGKGKIHDEPLLLPEIKKCLKE